MMETVNIEKEHLEAELEPEDLKRPIPCRKMPPGSVENKKGYDPDGELIGNSNTGVLHAPGCRAIDMMNKDHKVPTHGAHFRPCGWCHAGRDFDASTAFNESLDPYIGEEICTDPNLREIFKKAGCDTCHGRVGDVRMYPYGECGVQVEGREGLWWVYFRCYNCNYETALWKADQRFESMKKEKENELRPIRVI